MKHLFTALIVVMSLSFSTVLFSQGTPPTVGSSVRVTNLFYQYSYNPQSHRSESDFWKVSRLVSPHDERLFGLTGKKWYNFYTNQTISPTIDRHLIDRMILLQFKFVSDTSVVFTVPALLTLQGNTISLSNEKNLRLNAYEGEYYVRIVDRTGHPIWNANKIYNVQGNTINLDFSRPENVYGQNLVQVADGRYVVRTGDCDADGYVDNSDYVKMFNSQGAIGFLFTDFNTNLITNSIDFNYVIWNMFTGEIFPPGMGDSKEWKNNDDGLLSGTDYTLICSAAPVFPTEPRVRYFDLKILGNFNLGFSQYILKINRTIQDASIGIENFDSSIPHNSQIANGNEIRFGILPTNGIQVENELQLVRLRVTSSEIISDIQVLWQNEANPFATDLYELLNGQMVRITNPDNHIVNNLTGINETIIPVGYSLSQNYPNPFNPTTVISYGIPKTENVTLKVYNELGREVATLINMKQGAGNYSIKFNGSNLSSGIYYYKLESGNFVATKKMILKK